ncbi:MAG: helix-turn-helix domain-containing protein [Streptosporangiales bacterium]|nr:helix-turn-helix domain-containing protein [Streptosporangiales bacterium]
MAQVASDSGPVVRRILLGAQLRRLREAAGVSRERAGWEIRSSESKISRMELGRVGFKERDVADLLVLYGVVDESRRTELFELARSANEPGWWQKYQDVVPHWFQNYVGLEESASLIRTFEVQFIPGLLQTPDYARAVVRRGHPDATPEELDRRVELRMLRQERMRREEGPRLWAVIDEAALRRPIGGRDVMRAQLEHLLDSSKNPQVTIQVMPFAFGGHSAEGGAFTVLRFPQPDVPDVVYVEQLWGALYLDKTDDVEPYLQAMNRLGLDSSEPKETGEIIGGALQRL